MSRNNSLPVDPVWFRTDVAAGLIGNETTTICRGGVRDSFKRTTRNAHNPTPTPAGGLEGPTAPMGPGRNHNPIFNFVLSREACGGFKHKEREDCDKLICWRSAPIKSTNILDGRPCATIVRL